MELLWVALIVLGIIYGCFCTNKKYIIIIYGIILFLFNLVLFLNEKIVVNRYADIFVSFLVFMALCFSYYIKFGNGNIIDNIVYKIIDIISKIIDK